MNLEDDVRNLLTLIAIDKNEPVGRYLLKSILDISEGKTRGLLKKLSEKEIIRESKQGASLTEKGRNLLNNLYKKYRIKKIIEQIKVGKLSVGKEDVIINLEDGKIDNVKLVDIRDIAVRFGARGATIVKYTEGKFEVPTVYTDLSIVDVNLVKKFREKFELNPGDLLIISSGDNAWQALKGALAIVIYLSLATN
ncbi:MAG: DUF4443 domain-containing protein [Candidatus Odinarchaeia archaeon]